MEKDTVIPDPYEDESFFQEYGRMPRSAEGLPAAGEWPQMQKLLTGLANATVLDLGCGYGWHARYAAQQGARYVLGIDGSRKMLEKARAMTGDARIHYAHVRMEDFVPDENAYDVAISNLALNYISDLRSVYGKVYAALRPGGYFLINMEHPVFTSGVNQTFITGCDGKGKYWPVDQYFVEGERRTDFLGKGILKQHHTLTTILNGLIQSGFSLDAVEEVQPDRAAIEANGWWDELKRPMMLLVKAGKRR